MKSDESLYLENQLCFPLYAASRLTTKLYGPHLKKMDITYPQYLVLLVLWEYDTQTVSGLSEKLFLESNTLTPLLKRMEQKGLLTRVRSKEDERTVHIALTVKGVQFKEEAKCIPDNILKSFSSEQALKEDELIQFKKTLDKVITALHENVK